MSEDADDKGNCSKVGISHWLTDNLWLGIFDENDNEDGDDTENDCNKEGTTSATQTDHNNPFSSVLTSSSRQLYMMVSPLTSLRNRLDKT